MRRAAAGSRIVYYARAHHHVLPAWTALRRSLSITPHLVTLDRHTDFMPAFRRDCCRRLDPDSLGTVTPADIERAAVLGSAALASHSAASAKAAVRALAHDEHIDAARRADVIAGVFLLQSCSLGEMVPWANVESFDVPDANTADRSLEPYRLDPFISMIERGLRCRLKDATFILDIDLDYFHTRAGANPHRPATFRRLARYASLITIALEPKCVREPKLLDRGISAKQLLELVLTQIREA